jgi:hypothetical protein
MIFGARISSRTFFAAPSLGEITTLVRDLSK